MMNEIYWTQLDSKAAVSLVHQNRYIESDIWWEKENALF